MKDWLLHGAIETDEKMAADLAGPGYHINRSNLLVLESKADMQKRGQASPDDGDALALTFAQFPRRVAWTVVAAATFPITGLGARVTLIRPSYEWRVIRSEVAGKLPTTGLLTNHDAPFAFGR